MFDLPPSLRSRRLYFEPSDQVLTADIRENLQPPPEDAAADPEDYERHLAETFQSLKLESGAALSVADIQAAQATADDLWRAYHRRPRPQRKPTVRDRVAAARRLKHPPPPPAPSPPTASVADPQRREVLIKYVLEQFRLAELERRAQRASPAQNPVDEYCGEKDCGEKNCGEKDCGEKDCGEPPRPRPDVDATSEALPTETADKLRPEADTVPTPATAPAAPPPRRIMVELKWTPEIKAALAPFLIGDGEDEATYFEALAVYANLRMPTRIAEWRSVKSSFERERAAARAY